MTFPTPLSLKGYIGARGQSGVAQRTINRVPKHDVRLIPFLGSGQIASRLGPAPLILGNDLSKAVFNAWQEKYFSWIKVSNLDYRDFISGNDYSSERVFCYMDPPYLKSTRSNKYNLYEHDWEEVDHIDFLTHVKFYDFNCMISHFPNELYNDMLTGWYKYRYKTMTHGGLKDEILYMNYNPSNIELHNYDYLGKNNTDRQRIKRKMDRMISKFDQMPKREREAAIKLIKDRYL